MVLLDKRIHTYSISLMHHMTHSGFERISSFGNPGSKTSLKVDRISREIDKHGVEKNGQTDKGRGGGDGERLAVGNVEAEADERW